MKSAVASGWLRWVLAVVLVASIVGTAAGASPLAEIMASTPNRITPWMGEENPLPPLETVLGADQNFRVKVGPPEASLSVSVVEPRIPATPLWSVKRTTVTEVERRPRSPRGTILVLHGFLARSATMLPVAWRLADAEYRAVLVDLRGHGRSTGDHMTFGLQEARDLSQVIDDLQRRGLLAGPLGVYGISYGATTSIHLAANDLRVRAVVAVEPFSNARDEVPHFGRVMVPGVGLLLSEETYRKALDEAGRIAQYNPDDADAVQAICRTSAKVLIVHGTNDWVVPHWHGERLHRAAPEHSELISVPGMGHAALWFDPGGRVAAHARQWFDKWLKGNEEVRMTAGK